MDSLSQAVLSPAGIAPSAADGSITRDFTLEGARAFAQLGTPDKPFRFVFMTGMGTSQGTGGWFTPPYVKVKGETEMALKAAESESFKAAFVRPGGILATEEVSRRGEERREQAERAGLTAAPAKLDLVQSHHPRCAQLCVAVGDD